MKTIGLLALIASYATGFAAEEGSAPQASGAPVVAAVASPAPDNASARVWVIPVREQIAKPVLYVCNVEEESAATGNDFSARVFAKAKAEGANAVVVSAAIEADIVTMPVEDRGEFLSAMGLEEAGLAKIIRAGYDLLHLLTFFTVGPKEARAWTVHAGAKAPEAAGEIHSDMQRGFIRAETIAYDDFVTLGGEAAARDAGKLRQEGKEYVVRDGDVMHFKFNV
jgi:ribosome-binding ATPase YchF (GTP1/OBG family)